MLGWTVLMLICILFAADALRFGFRASLLSSFWVFTLFYTLSYPVKYLLINLYGIEYQAPIKPREEHLTIALLIAVIFWAVVYLFRRKPRNILRNGNPPQELKVRCEAEIVSVTAQLALLVMCGVSLAALIGLLKDNAFSLSLAFEGKSQNQARVGSGPTFLVYVLYAKALTIALFFSGRRQAYLAVVIGVVLAASFLEMVLLGTRRPPYLTVYMVLLWGFMQTRGTLFATILSLYPVAAVAMAPIGQVLRYSLTELFEGEGGIRISLDYALVSVGSTFEGVEHLANFVSRLGIREFVLGVDQGLAWIFNSGLALVPRIIWESKPYLYGSVAEQHFIYPLMYAAGPAQTTYPPGIVVDVMFGFGLVSLIPAACMLAKGLSLIDRKLFVDHFDGGSVVVLCASVYVYMFNVVRGGTSILMMVVMLGVMLGVISTLNRVRIGHS